MNAPSHNGTHPTRDTTVAMFRPRPRRAGVAGRQAYRESRVEILAGKKRIISFSAPRRTLVGDWSRACFRSSSSNDPKTCMALARAVAAGRAFPLAPLASHKPFSPATLSADSISSLAGSRAADSPTPRRPSPFPHPYDLPGETDRVTPRASSPPACRAPES